MNLPCTTKSINNWKQKCVLQGGKKLLTVRRVSETGNEASNSMIRQRNQKSEIKGGFSISINIGNGTEKKLGSLLSGMFLFLLAVSIRLLLSHGLRHDGIIEKLSDLSEGQVAILRRHFSQITNFDPFVRD